MSLGDFLVTMLLSALLVIATLQVWTGTSAHPERVVVSSGGKIVANVDIHKDQILEIDGYLGSSTLEIKQGRVRFIDSPCSHKQCILRGWVQATGDTVVCLPNRVSVTVSGAQSYYDAVNF